MNNLTAPERWVLLHARMTGTTILPLAIYACFAVGILALGGLSLSSVMLSAFIAVVWWERIGYTRLLARKDRPVVFRQTAS